MSKSLWMLLAAFLFSLSAVCMKFSADTFGVMEMVMYRSLVGVIAIWAWVKMKGFSLRTPLLGSHIKRSFLGTAGTAMWFYGVCYLPLGTAMTLNYTSALYVSVFAVFFAIRAGVRVPFVQLLPIVLGFIGVTLVLKPEFSAGQEFPAFVSLSSGFVAALAYYQIRELTKMREPEWRIVFFFSLFGTVAGFAAQLATGNGFSPLTLTNIWPVLGVGVTATLAQLAMTRAWGAPNVLLTSVFQYSAIVFSAVFGLVLFGDPVGWMSAAGIAVIMTAGVWASLQNKKKKA